MYKWGDAKTSYVQMRCCKNKLCTDEVLIYNWYTNEGLKKQVMYKWGFVKTSFEQMRCCKNKL
jgi:hypothetical protein